MKACKTCWNLLYWHGKNIRESNKAGLNIIELAFYEHNQISHPALQLKTLVLGKANRKHP